MHFDRVSMDIWRIRVMSLCILLPKSNGICDSILFHTHARTHTRTHVTHTHARTRAHTHTDSHTYTHTHTHTYARTQARSQTHTHAHAGTHAHTQASKQADRQARRHAPRRHARTHPHPTHAHLLENVKSCTLRAFAGSKVCRRAVSQVPDGITGLPRCCLTP